MEMIPFDICDERTNDIPMHFCCSVHLRMFCLSWLALINTPLRLQESTHFTSSGELVLQLEPHLLWVSRSMTVKPLLHGVEDAVKWCRENKKTKDLQSGKVALSKNMQPQYFPGERRKVMHNLNSPFSTRSTEKRRWRDGCGYQKDCLQEIKQACNFLATVKWVVCYALASHTNTERNSWN